VYTNPVFLSTLPYMDLLFRLFFLIVIIPSAIIHEVSHGLMADTLGDPTARRAGRLTLDPRVHIDMFGTIILPLLMFVTTGFVFAYAKPVPYNPYNLRNMRWGSALVGAAGPMSNFLLALVFSFVNILLPLPQELKSALLFGGMSSAPSFVGDSSLFMANLFILITIIIYANVLLGVFNLVPIPPLDGSKVLFALLPDRYENIKIMLERYGFAILLFFILFASRIIQPVIGFVFGLFVSGFGLF